MKIPKRLPEGLKALVEREKAFGRLTLLSARMRRRKGAADFELTYIDKLGILGDVLVTIDSIIYYSKDKPYKCKVAEITSTHRRKFDVFRKAVLAS